MVKRYRIGNDECHFYKYIRAAKPLKIVRADIIYNYIHKTNSGHYIRQTRQKSAEIV